MAAVAWEKLAPYFGDAFAARGQVEREDAINLAFAANESDDVIDAIDAIGSRIFRSLDDVKGFLVGQGVATG
jgi:hypothetical protein